MTQARTQPQLRPYQPSQATGQDIGLLNFGVTPQAFREQHFEQAVQLFRKALRDTICEWQDLDHLLQQNEPTPQGLQLFNHGLIDDASYTEDYPCFGVQRRRLNKVRFYGHLNAGATLVLNRVEMQWVAAQRLCAEVSRFSGQPATSNAYVSFRGDGTFGKHWDTHDVFAIQLIGRKRWRLFAPTLPLPLSHQMSQNSGHTCPEVAALDCVLESGDVLYIPRGWWHHVLPLDEGSLHLSVGTYAPTVHDYLMWVCSRVLPRDLRARPALGTGTADIFATLLETAGAAARDPDLLREFHQQIVQRERTTSEFNVGLFASPRLPALSGATQVRLNTCYTPVADAPLMVNGTALQLDKLSAQLVTLLAGSRALTLAQLEAKLPGATADAIRASVLNLNRFEIVSLDRSVLGASDRA